MTLETLFFYSLRHFTVQFLLSSLQGTSKMFSWGFQRLWNSLIIINCVIALRCRIFKIYSLLCFTFFRKAKRRSRPEVWRVLWTCTLIEKLSNSSVIVKKPEPILDFKFSQVPVIVDFKDKSAIAPKQKKTIQKSPPENPDYLKSCRMSGCIMRSVV